MVIIDIILGALILYGLIKGLSKGFFVEATSLLALLVGVYGAVHFSNYAAEFLSDRFEWGEKNDQHHCVCDYICSDCIGNLPCREGTDKVGRFCRIGCS